MDSTWSLAIDLVRQWNWRCVEDGVKVDGLDLCIANGDGRRLIRLYDCRVKTIARDNLRHVCGGPVMPVAPKTTPL